MRSYKRNKFNVEDFQALSSQKTEVEMPKDSVIDLWVEWYCSSPVTVNLIFATGIVVPYATSLSGHFNLQTVNLLSVLFVKEKKDADGAACVQYKDMAVKEKGDWTPVEIAPPPPLSVQLATLIDTKVRDQLERMGVMQEKIDVSEEDNLEEDIEDDEFGEGYMEDEEPIQKPKPRRKPAREPQPGDNGGSVNPGSVPNGTPGAETPAT